MGVSGRGCLKLLLLVTLLPLALRAATSLLFLGAGHDATPPSHHWRSPTASRSSGGRAATAAARASVSAAGSVSSVHGRPFTTQRRHRRRTESFDGARRLRHVDADAGDGGWFEDDKRLAPTGSNPLHNLR